MARPVSKAAPPPRTTVTSRKMPNESELDQMPLASTAHRSDLPAAAFEIGGAHFGLVQQFPPGSGQGDHAVDHDIAAVRELQRVKGVLLDQKDGEPCARSGRR